MKLVHAFYPMAAVFIWQLHQKLIGTKKGQTNENFPVVHFSMHASLKAKNG